MHYQSYRFDKAHDIHVVPICRRLHQLKNCRRLQNLKEEHAKLPTLSVGEEKPQLRVALQKSHMNGGPVQCKPLLETEGERCFRGKPVLSSSNLPAAVRQMDSTRSPLHDILSLRQPLTIFWSYCGRCLTPRLKIGMRSFRNLINHHLHS